MNAPRMPAALRAKLREVIAKMERGPAGETNPPHENSDPDASEWSGCSGGDAFRAGRADGYANAKLWRASWITPELRALLAWADGAFTCDEITEYGCGTNYTVNEGAT